MLSKDNIVFSRNDFNHYLNELSKEYKRLGGRKSPVEIILVGGAAVLANYKFREMTTDVDAIYPTASLLKEAANRIGDRFGLPFGWLNSDFEKTSSYSDKLYLHSTPYRTFNQVLMVRTVTAEYLIAMKLRSGRKYKNDLSDIVGILAEHQRSGNAITFEKIDKAVHELYESWENFPENSVTFIRHILSVEDYDHIYSLIQNGELTAQSTLVDFQNTYPGVVSADNVDSILQTYEAERADRESVLARLQSLKAQKENQTAQRKMRDKKPF